MIIKFALDNGWKYIEGIKEVSTNYVVNSPDLRQNIVYDDLFLYHHTYEDGQFKIKEGIELPILWVCCLMNNNQYKIYYSDMSLYLMSDEGKTIERIN